MGDRPLDVALEWEQMRGGGGYAPSYDYSDNWTSGQGNTQFGQHSGGGSGVFSGGGYMSAGAFISGALNSMHGGGWSGGYGAYYSSATQAYDGGASYNDHHSSWEHTGEGTSEGYQSSPVHNKYSLGGEMGNPFILD